jgi:ABC-2 type transport system permease protein
MVLPTPRWTLLASLGCVVIASLIVFATGPGPSEESLPLNMGMGFPTWIAAIVLGVWMAGLEYGQKTMRRTLTRNPNRIRVAFDKLVIALLATAVVSIAVTLLAAPLFALATINHDNAIPAIDSLRTGLGGLANNLVYAAAGFSFGLVTRSMAGGMTIALAFFFVVDSATTAIPKVGDYMLSAVTGETYQAIVGTEIVGTDLEVNLARAILMTLVWVALFLGVSFMVFRDTDVK